MKRLEVPLFILLFFGLLYAAVRYTEPGQQLTREVAIFTDGVLNRNLDGEGLSQTTQNSANTEVEEEPTSVTVSAETAPVEAPQKDQIPAFDVVRVERSGDAVIAGTAAPRTRITLLNNGETIAQTLATDDGDWVIVLEQPLPPGAHDLSLEGVPEDGSDAAISNQMVAIVVPDAPTEDALVVIAEAGGASSILQIPEEGEGLDIAAVREANQAVSNGVAAERVAQASRDTTSDELVEEETVGAPLDEDETTEVAELANNGGANGVELAQNTEVQPDEGGIEETAQQAALDTAVSTITQEEATESAANESGETDQQVADVKPQEELEPDTSVTVAEQAAPQSPLEEETESAAIQSGQTNEQVADAKPQEEVEPDTSVIVAEQNAPQSSPDEEIASAGDVTPAEEEASAPAATEESPSETEIAALDASPSDAPSIESSNEVASAPATDPVADKAPEQLVSSDVPQVEEEQQVGAEETVASNTPDAASMSADEGTTIAAAAPSTNDADTDSVEAARADGDGSSIASSTGTETKDEPAPGLTAVNEAEETVSDQQVAKVDESVEEQPAPAGPTPEVNVQAVEIEDGDQIFIAGTVSTQDTVLIYIGDELIGQVRPFAGGRWLLEADRSLEPGEYSVRADQISSTGEVIARAEVTFIREADEPVLSPVTLVASTSGVAGTGQETRAAVQKPRTVIIRRGDNLWTISRRLYGRGIRFTTIYQANQGQIRNPSKIWPGQVFIIPESDDAWDQAPEG